MWLSRVPVPDCPVYSVHQFLWGYFDVPDGDPRPFVYRVDDDGVLMLSRLRPRCKAASISIESGRTYQFAALVSPVNGCTRFIRDNEERRAWLARRLDGADLTFAQFFDRDNLHFKRAGGAFVTVARCVVRGTVYIRDRATFTDAILRGPGKAKAWGCGLVYLPEVMA